MLSPAIASILHSGRSDFNARFMAARHTYPDLNAEAFTEFLQTTVADFLNAVAAAGTEHLGEVTRATYDGALELVGQRLAGPGSRLPVIEEGWRRVLPGIAPLVVTAPERLIPAVSNALHQLAATPGARPQEWIERLEKLGPQSADAATFLKLGQVLAWRAGLAHFRQSALAAADALPEPLALAATGARVNSKWSDVRAQLLADPWFDPADAPESSGQRVVAQVGSFRGLGGLFLEPPLVVATNEYFLLRSNDEYWLLTADRFGATFHRSSLPEYEAASGDSKPPADLTINGAEVSLNGTRLDLPAVGALTSAAANATTLALTGRFTHSVVLVALK